MSPTNCIVPLRLRLTGSLDDLDDSFSDCVAGAVHARLQFASEQLSSATATLPPLSFHLPQIELPGNIDPQRASALRSLILQAIGRGISGDPAATSSQPRFLLADYKTKAPLPKLPDPWSITFRAKFRIRLRDFSTFSDSAAAGARSRSIRDQLTNLYADRLNEIVSATAWIVTVNTPALIDDIAADLSDRVQSLPENNGKFIGWVWSPDEAVRRELKTCATGGELDKLPTLSYNRGRILPDGRAYLLRNDRLLFAFLSLPSIKLDNIADVFDSIAARVLIKEVTPWINQPQFKEFFGISWSDYVREFGTEPVILYILPFTTGQRVPAQALRYLLREEAVGGISEEQAVFGHLQILNSETLGALPQSARAALQQEGLQSSVSAIPGDRADGIWEPDWFGAYIYTVVGPTTEERTATRYRPGARAAADRVIEYLKASHDYPWAFQLLGYLERQFRDQVGQQRGSPATAFEYFLQELEQREAGRWFNALFDGVEKARIGDLYVFLLQMSEQTKYASHPRVQASRSLFNARRRDYLVNSYDAKTRTILLDKNPSNRIEPGDFIKKPLSSTIKRIKADRLAALQKAVEEKAPELLGKILRGEDSALYSHEEFAGKVLAEAAKAIGLSDDDLEKVTVQRYLKYIDLKYENYEGVDRYWVTYELYDRIENEQLTFVENSRRTISESEFEFLLWAWEFEVSAAFWDTAIKVVSVAAVLAIAWEVGAIAVLVDLAGGAAVVLPSIAISVLIYACTAKHLTVEGFFQAALEGYLFALGFRFGGGFGTLAARQIGTQTIERFILGKFANLITTGAVGGASSAFLITFTNDILDIMADRRKGFRSLGEYVRQMELGAAMGIVFEFGGAALKPLLSSVGRAGWTTAVNIFDHLQVNGIGLRSWVELTGDALEKLTTRLKLSLSDVRLEGVPEAFAQRIAEITRLLQNKLELSIFRGVFKVKGFVLSPGAQRGLEKLLSGLGGRLEDQQILAFFNRLEANPAQLRRMLEALDGLDAATVRAISNSAELDAFAEGFLPKTPAPRLAAPRPAAPDLPPKTAPGEGEAGANTGKTETAPPKVQPQKFKSMDDILKPDRSGFLDPTLETGYEKYSAGKIREGETPARAEAWARRQSNGRYRDILENELGPDFARQGGESAEIELADIPRPGPLSESRLQTALSLLRSRLPKVFERLDNLKAKGIASGTVNSGHFNIAKGNVAEVLSEPIQDTVLKEIQKLHPNAEIVRGIRIRLWEPGVAGELGKFSDSKLFTDNLIGTWNGESLTIHGKFEVKSGPRGGAEATTQVFEWVEGRLTEGSQLYIPGRKPLTWHPSAPGPTVTGLGAGSKAYIITAEGAELYGTDSAMQTALEHGRTPLPYTASEIDYLTKAIIESLASP
jgi:hypothetical protein